MRTLALSLILAFALHAQPAEKQADVDRIFSAFNNHTPGCAVGVARNGSVVLKSAYGMADLERNVAISPETVFESGSLAKQFTAMALMLLAQQGKISLDEPLRKYLPELPEYSAPLTLRHVLSHVSGLREWRPIAAYGGVREGSYVYSNDDLLQMAARQHALNFDPGTHYSYTNTGYNIATFVFERVLGKGRNFQAFTEESIFIPLHMANTRWRDNFRTVVPNRALAYGLNGDKVLEQETPIENIIGAGGLLTNVGDLLLWNENFTSAKVGGPDLVQAQQTPARLAGGAAIAYASGLDIAAMDGLPEISHGGSTGGYRTFLSRYPDQHLSVAVMCNYAQARPEILGRDTARLWTGTVEKPLVSTFHADSAQLQALAGLYRKMRDNTVSELHYNGGKLIMGASTELIPTGPREFAAANGNQYRFEDGSPVRMHVLNSNDDARYERVDPVSPAAAGLTPLLGKYDSKETGSVLTVASGENPGELALTVAANPPLRLRPAFRDGFITPSNSSIFFIRDAAGKVVALSAGEDRVWDLRFTRIP